MTELLLVGGAGPSTLSIDVARQAIAQARNLGLRVTVTATDAAAPETRALAADADAIVETDLTDPTRRAEFVAGRGTGFDGLVFGVRDATMLAVAETARALGAPGNPPAAVEPAVYKDLGRAVLAAAGLRQPAFSRCAGAAAARDFMSGTAGPWVVKPRDESGSFGVTRVNRPDDLDAALSVLPDAGDFLIETFVTGEEFSVEGCFLRGEPVVLACTAKRVQDTGFVEIGHSMPAALSASREDNLTCEVAHALRTLGLRTGVFHVEAWLDGDSVVIGEIHTRVGGGWIHRMVEFIRPGVDLFGLAFKDALDFTPPRLPSSVGAAATRYLEPPPGELVAVDGWDAVRADPRVLATEFEVTVGDPIVPVRDSGDRVGAVVVGCPSPDDDPRAVARDLCRSVVFTMSDGSRHDGLGNRLATAETGRR